MKRFFKPLAYLLSLLLILIVGAATFIHFKGLPTYTVEMPDSVKNLKVRSDSTMVARGAKIATLLCNECHKGAGGKLTGKPMLDLPAEFGSVVSYNITQHPEHGIGNWTDGELYYFLRTGIRKDGSFAPAYMPKFPLMADQDLYSVIAWLRSSDPVLTPDAAEYPPNKPNFLVKLLSNTALKALPLPATPVSIPDSTDQIAFGKYVANSLCACYACHSEDFKTMDYLVPEKSGGFYGGGNPMLNYEGETVNSANITMDKETGIGGWTERQFYEATKFGKNPGGGPLYYPMFPHTTLSDAEVNAIFAYLQTVPPIKNAVMRYKPVDH